MDGKQIVLSVAPMFSDGSIGGYTEYAADHPEGLVIHLRTEVERLSSGFYTFEEDSADVECDALDATITLNNPRAGEALPVVQYRSAMLHEQIQALMHSRLLALDEEAGDCDGTADVEENVRERAELCAAMRVLGIEVPS